MRRSIASTRGSAFLELALVIPVLVLILVAAAEYGRMTYFSMEVADAARSGVAYGAQNTATAQDTSGISTAAKLSAADITSLSTSSSNSCVCETIVTSTGALTTTPITTCSGSSSTAGAQCPAVAAAGSVNNIVNYVQVNTQATVSTMFHYPGIPTSFTLKGFAKMRVVRN